jgi:hypothetical protein
MRAGIISIIILSCFVFVTSPVCAQEMPFLFPPIGDLSPLHLAQTRVDVTAPLTLSIRLYDYDYAAIAWRGITMHYVQAKDSTIGNKRPRAIDRMSFNSLSTKPVYDEKMVVRQAWKEALGIDIWYPYYQVKKVEGWMKKKVSVKVFGMKGEPVIEKGLVMYTFKSTF